MLRRLALALLLVPAAARGADVAVTVGSDRKPYQDVVAGLRSVLGGRMSVVSVGEGPVALPAEARLVVSVGRRAASQRYPRGVRVIYCLSPGVEERKRAGGAPPRVYVSPEPRLTAVRLKAAYPRLARLGVVWGSAWFEPNVRDLERAAAAQGVSVASVFVDGKAGLPDGLRAMAGKVDAFWTPMDPTLLDAESLEILQAFARSQQAPFFAPSAAMVDKGYAAASVGGSFYAVGQAAGRAALEALEGRPLSAAYYSASDDLVVGRQEAGRQGLPAEAARNAERVLP